MPSEMMGGAMPPEMMGGAPPPPPEDPIAAIQQEVADLRGLMQQLIDGQTAIIESLVGGSESLTASAPAADSESPEAVAPPAASPAADNNLIGLIQQDLRA